MEGLKIENVVASSSMERNLDLEEASRVLDGSEYDPEKFPGLVYRVSDPKTAILLFTSGKVVCTGGKTVEEARTSVNKVKKLLNEKGIETAEDIDVTVQNIVASYGLGADLNLNSVAITLGLERVEYEPEQFPGLVYRLRDSDVVLLLFGSGNMVCTGAKEIQDLEEAVDHIKDELKGAGLIH
ncbi:MAG: TATA-box-binding protein [Candidatus Saliniplasma sp.]